MVARKHFGTSSECAVDGDSSGTADLPFRIELWDQDNESIEHVVARAYSITLAQAVFTAACEQYPGRHLSLWRGPERLASTED